jgi:hypothetical protein
MVNQLVTATWPERPVLAGRDDLMAAIVLDGTSYVRIENLEISQDDQVPRNRRRFREGVHLMDKPGRHIALVGLVGHHIDDMGMNLQDVEHLLISNCRLEYCGGGAVGGPAGTHGGWRNVLIRQCEFSYSGHYYQGGDGSKRPCDRPDGFGIEPSTGPVEIAQTNVRHNRGDGLDSKAAHTYIHDCIVANNSCDGIKLWGTGSRVENCLVYGTGDGEPGPSSWSGIVIHNEEQDDAQFELVNITLHEHPQHENYQMYVQYGIPRSLRLVVRNCIFGGGYGAVYFGETVRLTAEHNLFIRANGESPVHVGERECSAAEIEDGALGAGNLCRDPKFRPPAWGREGDYHLQPGSPCIDSGTSQRAPAADLDRTRRPCGRAVDMGCYEFKQP